MDKMSLFSVLTVSSTEIPFDILLGLLVIGQWKRLSLSVENAVRFGTAFLLMNIASYLVRAYSPNIVVVLALNILTYIAIFKVTYNTAFFRGDLKGSLKDMLFSKSGWKASAISVLFFVGLIVTIELLYMPSCIKFMTKSLDNLLKDDWMRLAYSIPERLIQLGTVIYLYKVKTVFINLKKYDNYEKECTPLIFLSLAMEAILLYVFVRNLDDSPIAIAVLIGMLLSVAANSLLFRLLIKFTKTVRLQILSNKQKHNTISVVGKLLQRNEIEKARRLAELSIKKASSDDG